VATLFLLLSIYQSFLLHYALDLNEFKQNFHKLKCWSLFERVIGLQCECLIKQVEWAIDL